MMNRMAQNGRMTLNRFLVAQQKQHPEASGEFTRFMNQVGTAAKIIANHMRRASLEGLLGQTGSQNVQGEDVKHLDEVSNQIFVEAFEYVDIVGMLISEEMAEAKLLAPEDISSGYIVMVDPVDGSANIDVNGIIGSIFSVHDISGSVEESLLQRGSEQVAAGYIMYGPATVLVYTAGHGVHSFVLDTEIGEFILDHATIHMPQQGSVFSANVGNYLLWPKEVQGFTDQLMAKEAGPYALRYSGALLADFHRILFQGGVFYYPQDEHSPQGKLRLLYECAPLAMIAEQAGGEATDGTQRVMDIDPEQIHQRTPFAVGSKHEITLYENCLRSTQHQP